ncbi:MAG: phosphoribosylformylglycinamidine cyclo-ligase [Firmicutes bacterium]|nr:phosphoribosylformylglycinamidine cyclo-ligase [Bacillota bacterium]
MIKYDVNIDLANEAKAEISAFLGGGDSRILSKPADFACLYDIGLAGYRHPVLVLKTEEPGSKQLIAMRYDRVEGVCRDMINHLVNDCAAVGAAPLAVQDAVICGKLDKNILKRVIKAISEACAENGCLLTGGETSEQPQVIEEGRYILTSSIVGVVEKDQIIDGRGIAPGDAVVGLASNGVHTNGYTLIRRLMAEKPEILDETADGESFTDAILRPHTAYYGALRGLFGKGLLKGLAHITGGGVRENLNRVLPDGADAVIELDRYDIPEIFRIIRRYSGLDDASMLRTYNMGVGYAAVTAAKDAEEVIRHFDGMGVPAKVIGRIVTGNRRVECVGGFMW